MHLSSERNKGKVARFFSLQILIYYLVQLKQGNIEKKESCQAF